jgi:hypothetical protein
MTNQQTVGGPENAVHCLSPSSDHPIACSAWKVVEPLTSLAVLEGWRPSPARWGAPPSPAGNAAPGPHPAWQQEHDSRASSTNDDVASRSASYCLLSHSDSDSRVRCPDVIDTFSPSRCTCGTRRWWLHQCSAARPAPASASAGCLQSTHKILMLYLADSSFDRDQTQEQVVCTCLHSRSTI